MDYIEELMSSGFAMETLIHGNLKKETALHLVGALRDSGLQLAAAPSDSAGTHFRDRLLWSQHLKLDMEVDGERRRQFVLQRTNSNEQVFG